MGVGWGIPLKGTQVGLGENSKINQKSCQPFHFDIFPCTLIIEKEVINSNAQHSSDKLLSARVTFESSCFPLLIKCLLTSKISERNVNVITIFVVTV